MIFCRWSLWSVPARGRRFSDDVQSERVASVVDAGFLAFRHVGLRATTIVAFWRASVRLVRRRSFEVSCHFRLLSPAGISFFQISFRLITVKGIFFRAGGRGIICSVNFGNLLNEDDQRISLWLGNYFWSYLLCTRHGHERIRGGYQPPGV